MESEEKERFHRNALKNYFFEALPLVLIAVDYAKTVAFHRKFEKEA